MKKTPYVAVYSITLLLSAFLLFSVQPLFGKMLLPLLGGSPSVWNTAMLFFQIALLAGYAYAHGTTKLLGIRTQAGLHLMLFAVFLVVLPIALPADAFPPEGTDPTMWQLAIMAMVVGGPFFVLAGTTPMLQRWFTHTPHPDAHNPYFLYAASNLGSVTALLAYPFIIEPLMGLKEQAMTWATGYLLLIVLIIMSLGLAWSHSRQPVSETASSEDDSLPDEITWKRRFMWLILAFVPSSLMLGVTTYITTDIASAPLFWIAPLAIYVASFIVAFARRQPLSYRMAVWIQTLLFAGVAFYTMQKGVGSPVLIFSHLGLFAFTAIVCHIDLARLRPSAKRLTEFYLIMSAGGALGGVFNALIAPNIFLMPIEYPLILSLAAFLRFMGREEYAIQPSFARTMEKFKSGNLAEILIVGGSLIAAFGSLTLMVVIGRSGGTIFLAGLLCAIALLLLYDRRWTFAVTATAVLCVANLTIWFGSDTITRWDRNFFGIIRITESSETGLRYMVHGTTIHGGQPLSEEYRLLPVTYYSTFTTVGDIFEVFDRYQNPEQRIGVIGLGVGAINCYGDRNRHFDYFEIDPDVAAIAEDPKYFSYLQDCGPSYDIFLGDGRIKIADMPDNVYDMFVLDAFSSDNIPVHLLTIEAFELYVRKLKEDGILVFNISNRYLDLRPVISANARQLGMTALFKMSRGGEIINTTIPYSATIFGVVTNNDDMILDLYQKGWRPLSAEMEQKPWTDDYANIISVIRYYKKIEVAE